jgi:hypothetical protein
MGKEIKKDTDPDILSIHKAVSINWPAIIQ